MPKFHKDCKTWKNGDGLKDLWEVFPLMKTTYTCTQMFSYGQTSFFKTCPLNIFLTVDGHGNHVSYFCTYPSLLNLLCCTSRSCLKFNIKHWSLKVGYVLQTTFSNVFVSKKKKSFGCAKVAPCEGNPPVTGGLTSLSPSDPVVTSHDILAIRWQDIDFITVRFHHIAQKSFMV